MNFILNLLSINKWSICYFRKTIIISISKRMNKSGNLLSIYRNKADVIPIGVRLQAVTKERSLFNVFLPNIDPNIVIDYKKYPFKLKK